MKERDDLDGEIETKMSALFGARGSARVAQEAQPPLLCCCMQITPHGHVVIEPRLSRERRRRVL